MVHRRSSAIAAGMLLLAAPVLSSCGFDYATDRVNTISTGVNDRDGEIDVLGAAIIAGEDNAGLFVGTLANNSTTEDDTLTTVGGEVTPADDFTPVPVPGGLAADLFDIGGVSVTGSFEVGDFVPVTLEFANGQRTTVDVNVVKPCFQYDPEKFDPPLVLPSSTGDAIDSAAEGAEPGPYSCEIETADEPEEHQ